MDLKDYYMKTGGSFDEVLGRLRLETSMGDKDYDEALRAVHTLKGICQNLSFARLFESSSLVTKALKENDWNQAVDMMPRLSRDYYELINAIEELKRSKEE